MAIELRSPALGAADADEFDAAIGFGIRGGQAGASWMDVQRDATMRLKEQGSFFLARLGGTDDGDAVTMGGLRLEWVTGKDGDVTCVGGLQRPVLLRAGASPV